MRLLVHSYFPILTSHQAGGAQYAMREILAGLANHGMDITILCPETEHSELFTHERIETLPVLREQVRKPLNLHDRLQNLSHIAAAAENADVVWTLDALFPLQIDQPIVLTLQTIAYEDELDSLFGFNWDVAVAASPYLASIVESVAGPGFWSGDAPEIRVIQNGINADLFIPTDPAPLQHKLGLPPGKYILFPHRPEPAKGFDAALAALKRLVQTDPGYKLLIPTQPSSVKYCLDKERRYYNRLLRKVEQLGLSSAVIFHPWIALEDLPAYYSLGQCCLVLSMLPEGFGFTPVQSVSCGTPVVSTKAGSLREKFPPDHGVTYVEVGDVSQIVSGVLADRQRLALHRGQEYVRVHYSIERCVKQYIDCFTDARKKRGRYLPGCKPEVLHLSPWCYFVGPRTVWHDLHMKPLELTHEEAALLHRIGTGLPLTNSESLTTPMARLLARGLIVGGPKGTSGRISAQ